MSKKLVCCAMIGGIREDYCITHDGRAISGALGGNAVYAAVGARLWAERIAIISRVGSNFPGRWLNRLSNYGISTSGVRILDEEIDTRTFYAYRSLEERVDTDPTSHYSRFGLSFPKALEGYHSSTQGQEEREQLHPSTVRVTDIPESLLGLFSAAHFSPSEYLTHLTLPSYLEEHGAKTITLDPSIRYMSPSFKHDLPTLLSTVSAFLPSLYEANAFVPQLENQFWEMADLFHSMGPDLVVIKAGAAGQYLSNASMRERWHIPAYPTTPKDVTGAGDAFCGGFLAGLSETHDPVEAALRGNISASFVIEGSGALYALDTPPALSTARLEDLRGMIRRE